MFVTKYKPLTFWFLFYSTQNLRNWQTHTAVVLLVPLSWYWWRWWTSSGPVQYQLVQQIMKLMSSTFLFPIRHWGSSVAPPVGDTTKLLNVPSNVIQELAGGVLVFCHLPSNVVESDWRSLVGGASSPPSSFSVSSSSSISSRLLPPPIVAAFSDSTAPPQDTADQDVLPKKALSVQECPTWGQIRSSTWASPAWTRILKSIKTVFFSEWSCYSQCVNLIYCFIVECNEQYTITTEAAGITARSRAVLWKSQNALLLLYNVTF